MTGSQGTVRPVRWLVTGAGGKLGRDLTAVLAADPRAEVTALRRADLDITDPTAVSRVVPGHDIVVNTAAWTDVDAAEQAEEAATEVNGTAVRHLSRACAASNARLLHISTDYVFAGNAVTPYPEDAPTAPVNAYGRSKLAGEQAVTSTLPDTGYVVRTAWLYGAHGRDFVKTVLSRTAAGAPLSVVTDQHGQPTWSRDLAVLLARLGRAALAGDAPPGVYHGTASGRTTWYGLAREVLALDGRGPGLIHPTASAAFPRPAPRPAYGVLAHDRWSACGLAPPPPWRESLARALRT
ncbi:dTDP-4-dehydrorhamnose reductase [Streptomyces misionensis]|uniref:dTDP-4-dehydrorhamnose reductase n=1 Tax=Streptomyces misionensis TaxID=67331 RepID=A0A5C6JTV7_9ACTN|nr:dTDP-4-dehydrorhamnose reductase [Streptomyces misionensis]TWV46981.1 dTDP-4-dehydrorhamnose reductase [Streptomyces misionensis]